MLYTIIALALIFLNMYISGREVYAAPSTGTGYDYRWFCFPFSSLFLFIICAPSDPVGRGALFPADREKQAAQFTRCAAFRFYSLFFLRW